MRFYWAIIIKFQGHHANQALSDRRGEGEGREGKVRQKV